MGGGLCEIGCGSGLVLRHLSTVLGELREFVGIDLSEAQCRLNRVRFAATRLRFESADAIEWIRANVLPGRVYFTNGGV